MLEILFLSSAGRAENFTSPPSVLMILVYVMVKSPHLLVDTMHGWLYLFPYSSNSHNPVVIQIVTITAMPKAITVSKMPQCLQRNATRPPSGMSTIVVPITFLTAIFSFFTSLLHQLLDGHAQIICDLLWKIRLFHAILLLSALPC